MAADPLTLLACEPILPIVYVFLGPVMAFSAAKVGGAALVGVVGLKMVLFARRSGLPPVRAALLMLGANAATTVIGAVVGVLLGSGPPEVVLPGAAALGVVTAIGARVAARGLKGTSWERLTPGTFGAVSVLLVVWSLFCFGIMQNVLYDPNWDPLEYWALKVLGLFGALGSSIILTVSLETAIILTLSRPREPQRVLGAAVWANLVTLLVAFSVGAALAIPHRLRRTDFLWFHGN